MKKMKNEIHIEGKVYEHDLELKVTGENSKKPGTEFISGILKVATDNDCLNVVDVHFTYVTATTSKGSVNATFTTLKNIIDGVIPSVMGAPAGVEAGLVRIDSAFGLNDFPTTDRTTGQEIMVSVKRAEGGFVHTANLAEISEDENARASFKVDMLINSVSRKEANEERNLPEKMILKGAIFDFRKSLLPVEFTVLNPAAMDYFDGLDISTKNPVLTELRGQIVSKTVFKQIEEESAFGEPSIRTVKNTNKDYVITWAARETQDWDDENTITAQELIEARQQREIYLADVKRRSDEYKASKASNSAFSAPTTKQYTF